jgi:hypothetical protein
MGIIKYSQVPIKYAQWAPIYIYIYIYIFKQEKIHNVRKLKRIAEQCNKRWQR